MTQYPFQYMGGHPDFPTVGPQRSVVSVDADGLVYQRMGLMGGLSAPVFRIALADMQDVRQDFQVGAMAVLNSHFVDVDFTRGGAVYTVRFKAVAVQPNNQQRHAFNLHGELTALRAQSRAA